MSNRFVLDSFALMALFQSELGGPRVRDLFGGAAAKEHELFMSVVNLGEVLYTIENRQGLTASLNALAAIDQFPVEIIEVDRRLALEAARLKAIAKLGYADCFAAALAQQLGAAVVTGDPDFKRVEDIVTIEWLPS